MSRNAFFCVAFPAQKDYLEDMLLSLDGQTYKDFDVVIANEGVDDLNLYTKNHPGLKVISFDVPGPPSLNRQKGFEYLLAHNYESVVFGDMDDYYASDRVGCSLELLKSFDVVANDFDLVDNGKKVLKTGYLSSRLKEGQIIEADFIRNKNVLGFGSTALKVARLRGIFLDEQAIALDWYLFSRILGVGAKAVFTTRGKTFHRVYDNNLASIDRIDEKSVLNGLKAKTLHYECLAKIYPQYAAERDNYQKVYRDVSSRKDFRDEYIEAMRKGARPNNFWYEDIQLFRK